MRHTELVSLIALRQCPGIGDITIKKLLGVFKSSEEILAATPAALTKIAGIGSY
ncbi:MAG: DNA-protecting protein DprA, partial [Moraxellaceae bacterium]